ncbi:hypothetical protein LCGC14_1602470, partial [marine sediment metagenome]
MSTEKKNDGGLDDIYQKITTG